MASKIANYRANSGSSSSARMIPLLSFLVFLTVLSLFSSMRESTHIDTLEKLRSAAFPNYFTFNTSTTSTTTCRRSTSTEAAVGAPNPSPADPPAFRLFIGILTQADQYWRRNILRLAYGIQTPPPDVHVDVKFVFCSLFKEDQRVLISLEIIQFEDILILNCTENMDSGKTFVYFSSLPELFGSSSDDELHGRGVPPYDYVMKADDDTYFRVNQLVESLRPLAREDLYYGFTIPCKQKDPFHHYMSGMGYLLSWDLVEWISTSEVPRNYTEGPEDKLVGDWLEMGDRGKNRYNAKPAMFDYPANGRESPDHCEGPFAPDTIGVHRLKSPEKWVDTFQRFNVTEKLRPSKLYYI